MANKAKSASQSSYTLSPGTYVLACITPSNASVSISSAYFQKDKALIYTFDEETTVTITGNCAILIAKLKDADVRVFMYADMKFMNTHGNTYSNAGTIQLEIPEDRFLLAYTPGGNVQAYSLTLDGNDAHPHDKSWGTYGCCGYYPLAAGTLQGYSATGGGDGGQPTTNGLVLMALRFEKKKAVMVAFDKNGGEGDANPKNVFVGDPYGELPVVTKTGYDFLGWYNNDILTEAETIVETESNHSLQAQYKLSVTGGSTVMNHYQSAQTWSSSCPYGEGNYAYFTYETSLRYGLPVMIKSISITGAGTFAVSNNTTKTEQWYSTVATVYVDGVAVGTQSFPAKTSATYTIELPEPIIGQEIKIVFNRNMYYSWQYSVTAAGKYVHGCAFYCQVKQINVDYEEIEA